MTLQLSIVPTCAYREILRSLIGKPLKSIPFSVKAGGLHFNNEISSFNGEHIFIPIELYGGINYRSDAPGDYGDPLFELIEVYE